MPQVAIYYWADDADLDAAADELTGHGLALTREDERLYVDWPFKGRTHRYTVTRTLDPGFAAVVRELRDDDDEYERYFARCDARFEIHIDDLDVALDEINTLIIVEQALLAATRGFLYTPWNGRFLRWSELT